MSFNYKYLIENCITEPEDVLVYTSVSTLEQVNIDFICKNLEIKVIPKELDYLAQIDKNTIYM